MHQVDYIYYSCNFKLIMHNYGSQNCFHDTWANSNKYEQTIQISRNFRLADLSATINHL